MKRLLMYFSYIGTNYRGLQSTSPTTSLLKGAPDLDTVQGILEFGLKKVLRAEQVNLFVSSRTDTSVHARETTAQFNLDDEKFFANAAYSPEKICQHLNLFLEKNECDIRVKRIQEVPLDFSCRTVICRTYEFRLGVLNGDPFNTAANNRTSSALEITDLNRCTLIPQPFDIAAVQDACKIFVGQWNFTTFMKSSRKNEIEFHKRFKTLRKFSIAPAVIEDKEWDNLYGSLRRPPYDVYNVSIEGSGFLRRQVRRMVGALVALGKGAITSKDILWMLENPSEQNWNNNAQTLAPYGLFLKEITYPKYEVLRGYYS